MNSSIKEKKEDILEPRRRTSDIRWALRSLDNVPIYKEMRVRTPALIKENVLHSARVQHVVEQLAWENKEGKNALMNKARKIVEEMGHNFGMGSVRCLAFILPKVFKTLFRQIYVNQEGVEKLRKLMREKPVVLLPSHRSYMDFLIMSYLCYNYNLTLPVIAAGADFMAMRIVGSILRNCGAFFIRRSFGVDRLYWAVFTEYVQTHLINGDAPVEFFVEGTRSRSGKSLPPKLGLLSVALEPYFNGKVNDIALVPISISFEKPLEETLYAREMLGIPKPKESTSGLIKARSILHEDYGSFYVYFNEPISVRQLAEGKVDRSVHSLVPRYIFSMSAEEQRFVKGLAYDLVLQQQSHMVLSTWSLVACVLMCSSGANTTLEKLYQEVFWLKDQACYLGGCLDWPEKRTAMEIVDRSLSLHHAIVTVTNSGEVMVKMTSKELAAAETRERSNVASLIDSTTPYLILTSYRNQSLHVFVRTAFLALSLPDSANVSHGELFGKYTFLCELFSEEFIFNPTAIKQDMNGAVKKLQDIGIVKVTADSVSLIRPIQKLVKFLRRLFTPFLTGYWILCQHLVKMCQESSSTLTDLTVPIFAKRVQEGIAEMIKLGFLQDYDILSLNLLTNATNSLIQMKAIEKVKRNGKVYLNIDVKKVINAANKIGEYAKMPSLDSLQLPFGEFIETIRAKL